MTRIMRALLFGPLVVALVATSAAPAVADSAREHHIAIRGTSVTGPFDLADCVAGENSTIVCDHEREGTLFVSVDRRSRPGQTSWYSAGVLILDFSGAVCFSDTFDGPGIPMSGSEDGVIVTSDGSEIFVHRDYTGCTLEGGGHVVGTFTFTGGTGRFDGATGSAVLTILGTAGPSTLDPTRARGTITY